MKKIKGNLFKRHSEHKEGDYITLHKEIARYKDENGLPLPLTLLGMQTRIRTLPDDWDFNIKGLAKICNISTNTASKYLNQLIELGYIEVINRQDDNGKFQTPKYISNETTDSNLWKTKEVPEEFKENDLKKPNTKISNMDSSNLENEEQYKKDNKHKKKNKKSKNNISKKDNFIDILKSSSKEVKTKAQKLLDQIYVLVDEDIQDFELNTLIKDYLSYLVEKGQTITIKNYQYRLKKLIKCSSDIEEQKIIVSTALERGWKGFYPINKQYLKSAVSINSIPEETDEPDFEFALDENGKPYEF